MSLQLVAALNSRNNTAKQCIPVQMANYPADKPLKPSEVHMVSRCFKSIDLNFVYSERLPPLFDKVGIY